MSPVPMMDEMGIPTIYLEALVLKCAELLKKKRRHVPDIVMAGGFISESQIYKAIAMSNFGEAPLVKATLMARSPLTAVMKSSYFMELYEKGQLPKTFVNRYGNAPESFFVSGPELKVRYGDRFKDIPWEAVGLFSYLNDRVGVGLRQLLAGSRKWKLTALGRNDLIALTERAAKVTGIPLPEESEMDAVKTILS